MAVQTEGDGMIWIQVKIGSKVKVTGQIIIAVPKNAVAFRQLRPASVRMVMFCFRRLRGR